MMNLQKKSESDNRKINVAIAIALILAIVGVMAYFADASTAIRNLLGSDNSHHLEVEIVTETGAIADNGFVEYVVRPSETNCINTIINVDTNGDAYVYAIVKNTVNSHGKTLVDYQIADGWVELDKSTLTDKDIQKYNEIFTDKDMADKVHIDVDDPYTHIYYRIVNGTDDESRFEYPVLEGNLISYPATLTDDDLDLLKNITEEGDRALDFQTYAVQMTPFCPADKVKDDPTSDEQKVYAAEAWNQKAPAPAATDPEDISTKAHSITVYPTVPGDQYIVVPKGTTPTEDNWTTTGQTSNGGEALTFTGLDADTEYDVISRTPAKSEQEIASKPSVPTTVRTGPLVESITVTEKSGKTSFAVDENAQMVATVEPEDADKEVTWSSSDPSVATVDPDTGKVTCVGGGTATITATAKDRSGVTGTYDITVPYGKLLYQVKLKSISGGTATFWPAFNTKTANYGKHEHEGDCIVDHTWAEIASQTDNETGESLDFGNCMSAGCTKDVPIDISKNSTVFKKEALDYRDTIVSHSTSDGYCHYSHPALTNAITQCADIKGVSFSFFTPTYNQITTLSQSERKLFISTGAAKDYWLSEADFGSDVYIAIGINADGAIAYAQKTDPLCIVLGLNVTAN